MISVWTILLLIILAAIALVLIMAAMKPDIFKVERKTVIRAKADVVFAQINTIRNWEKWSPWQAKDPGMKQSYSAIPSGVGASMEWSGNKDVGTGRMGITESVPHEKIVWDLVFLAPMKAQNVATFRLNPASGGTEVVWTLAGPCPFISKIVDTVIGLDKMIGRDFEAGLENLRRVVES